ncbi:MULTISPECIES: 2-C-methyl-D-erythritol 4-phosphate cytidylyltransferase [Providencia]|uniref:2-C-methyl-D-erythritol 4-phosphate cytidylyltransferase n=1 Tax=Providencia TaxID=586 RepID=UPI0005B351BF|nr:MULTISPECIES: 2-C-methyl-D-erythritol 4-phosphate cytidylyltransferase [Providencia]EIU7559199.1 2-C-methyl-D-erythritol 4-phosphate cytidylyltransferase [Providencia rettgeri]EJD6501470.1 2-C-methyl-D-erythritol 4-phosphate cytidylyltransferase [Providencia rettgeri]EJD6644597.1 2-C-methyl-D-erythritol 4-phosphate cytidylyltransferase [Providencia rettgeri]EJD6673090.1 2-C-methyl-D-erythritol 4-phosphate cytidylyltransferase [Providencia rettgeri]ELL9155724.1 2-C-methyl-D-erythritol 4-phos
MINPDNTPQTRALQNNDPQIVALIPAAGIGSRMNADCPKQYLRVAGKTIIEHTLSALLANNNVKHIIIALSSEDEYFQQLAISTNPRITAVIGGKERADSVLAGVNFLAAQPELSNCWVLVHDAARPCLHQSDLNKIIQLTTEKNCCGGILAAPVRDTMKRSLKASQLIDHTVEREALWHALTPQFFPLLLLRDCLSKALKENAVITDEASALEYCGYQPVLVPGRADNLKVTRPEDLTLAEFYLSRMNN